jgi:hypothetical protein
MIPFRGRAVKSRGAATDTAQQTGAMSHAVLDLRTMRRPIS